MSHESLFEESEAPYAALCVVANFTTDGELAGAHHQGYEPSTGDAVKRMSHESVFQQSEALYTAYFSPNGE